MRNKLIAIILLLVCLSCLKKSDTRLSNTFSDSLSLYLTKGRNNHLSINKRIKFNQKALQILSVKDNNLSNRNDLYQIAQEFYILESDKNLKKSIKLLLEKSVEKKDILNIAKSYNILGNQNINHIRYDSAYFYFLKSEKLFVKLKDSLSLGKNFIDKAFVQLYENDYSGCELSCIQALNYYKNFNDNQRKYDAYNLIGICSNEKKNYENALIYHKKALNVVRDYKLITKSHLKANSLNNIGVVYQNLNNHKEAIKNFQEALSERDLLKDTPSLYAMITDNLGYSKLKLKDFNNLPSLFFESLNIREKNQFFSSVIINKIHLSEFFAIKKDTFTAQKFANQAFLLAQSTKISGDLLLSLKQLSLVEHKKASEYSKEYIKISDSIQLEERKAKDKFARIAFETDEIIVEKDKLAEQNRSLLYFFLCSLFVGLLLFVIRTQRAKNRELLLKQQQQKANEDIYNLMISQQTTIEENRVKEKKRIAQELHDGVLGRLFGARLNLDSLNKFTDSQSIETRFNYLEELKNIEQDIREISHDLNREKFVLINNFVAIVHNLLEEQKNSFNPDLKFTIDEKIEWDAVSNGVKINLYRILQESLQNINKYAEARNVQVEFTASEELIILKVIDDGSGFDVSSKKRGIGLQNMQSRTAECHGIFDVKSKKGKGTSIIVSMPIMTINNLVEFHHEYKS